MRLGLLSAVLLALIGVPGAINAQAKKDDKIKTAQGEVGGKITWPTFDPSKGKLKHGQKINFGAGKNATEGTFVRYDPKGERVFVRAEPGTLPKSILMSDVKNVAQEEGKNGKPAAPLIVPEIQGIEILNGAKRLFNYSAPTLSPGELSLLREMQDAQNELSQIEDKAARENLVLDNSIAIQTSQKRAYELLNRQQEIQNNFLTQQAARVYWGWGTGYDMAWNGYYGYGYGFNNVGSPGLPIGQMYGSQRLNYPTAPMVIPNFAAVTPPETLAKARQNVMVLQQKAVYENHQLVAVVP